MLARYDLNASVLLLDWNSLTLSYVSVNHLLFYWVLMWIYFYIFQCFLDWFKQYKWLLHGEINLIIWHIYWCMWKQLICTCLHNFYSEELLQFKGQLLMIWVHLQVVYSPYTNSWDCWSIMLLVEVIFQWVWCCFWLVYKRAYQCIWKSC